MKKSATCSKCGKPLTDPVSIAARLGPVCRLNRKLENMHNGNLFANRSEYDYGIEGDVVWIRDIGELKSVTNDMENVLADISKEHDISRKKIMYLDSDKVWDGVTATISKSESGSVHVTNLGFFPITETDFLKAKEKLCQLRV